MKKIVILLVIYYAVLISVNNLYGFFPFYQWLNWHLLGLKIEFVIVDLTSMTLVEVSICRFNNDTSIYKSTYKSNTCYINNKFCIFEIKVCFHCHNSYKNDIVPILHTLLRNYFSNENALWLSKLKDSSTLIPKNNRLKQNLGTIQT